MMRDKKTAVITGCGEIGTPLYQLSCGCFEQVIAVDPRLGPPENPRFDVEVLHIAIPGSLPRFSDICTDYINQYKPEIVLIHSSSFPGTTDKVIERFNPDLVVHTQVHGKHKGDNMRSDMLRYPKFIATCSDLAFRKSKNVLVMIGHPPQNIIRLSSPLAGELVKLLATSFFGYLIAWAQEVERLSDRTGISYKELMSFTKLQADDYRIDNKFPGVIGGHCVIPNLEILQQYYPSGLWDFIIESNKLKAERTNV